MEHHEGASVEHHEGATMERHDGAAMGRREGTAMQRHVVAAWFAAASGVNTSVNHSVPAVTHHISTPQRHRSDHDDLSTAIVAHLDEATVAHRSNTPQ